MGFKRVMDRIKRKIKRKKGLLLASLIILFFMMGIMANHSDARSLVKENNPNIRIFCPTCMGLAYVGLDEDYLTLYDGPPANGEIVLRLFKLDIEAIDSMLPEGTLDQLMTGIQVSDQVEYDSVLSSFNDYALE